MKALFVAAILGTISFSAAAQAPTIRGDETKVETNCPPSKPNDARPVQDSIILPDAGGEKNSAAPTTQRQGETVVASQNCSKEVAPQKKE